MKVVQPKNFKDKITPTSQLVAQNDNVRLCHEVLISQDITYGMYLDADEYMVPLTLYSDLAHEIDRLFLENPTAVTLVTSRSGFSSVPHILEPVDRLTIESFFMRSAFPTCWGPCEYSKGLMPKRIVKLIDPNYSKDTMTMVRYCCGVHRCGVPLHDLCKPLIDKTVLSPTEVIPQYWASEHIQINHYSGSVERFLRKPSWGFSQDLDSKKVLYRSQGNVYDPSALRFSCAVREELRSMTHQAVYSRPGGWIRDYELTSKYKNPYQWSNRSDD